MKVPVFPLRLFPEDQKRRKLLEKTLRDSSGRKMDFASILRQLMTEKTTDLHRSQDL